MLRSPTTTILLICFLASQLLLARNLQPARTILQLRTASTRRKIGLPQECLQRADKEIS